MSILRKTFFVAEFILLFSFIILLPVYASEADTYLERALSSAQKGDFGQTILNAKEAGRLFEKQGNIGKQIQAFIYLSNAYQSLGHYNKSLKNLKTALDLAKKTGDRGQSAYILEKLGSTYIFMERLEEAETYLNKSLSISYAENYPDVRISTLNNLGNLYTLQKKYNKAIATYKTCSELFETTDNKLYGRVMANMAKALVLQGKNYLKAEKTLGIAYEIHSKLTDSHDKAYGLINIGQTYCHLGSFSYSSNLNHEALAVKILKEAAVVAGNIKDNLAESYAYGYLGSIYEEAGLYSKAMHFTRKALFMAQQTSAQESLYKWQWQSGRLLQSEGKMDAAIESYRRAVYTLEMIRLELLGNCKVFNQLSFQHKIEQLYFGLADLLLKRSDSTQNENKRQSYFREVRRTIELLKVAELQDYFQDACVVASSLKIKELDSISPGTGIIYAIPLPDRLELLLGLSTGIMRFTVNVEADSFFRVIKLFRKALKKHKRLEYLPRAQKLYSYIIKPLETELADQKIDTLVFVPHGLMLKIPLAALHDGSDFLINKFAVAVTPGLSLTDPQPIQMEKTEVLLAGLSKSIQGFPALQNVPKELRAIRSLYKSKILQDQDFRMLHMTKEFERTPYSILHIASHVEFSDDSKDTFIVTWDGRITMDDLQKFMALSKYRKESVDLLTLSACVTAEGSDKAALGLAGIGVKAGAKSALASLWYIHDYSTYRLITEFYRVIHDEKLSKAKALQQAQIQLINDQKFQHPFFWAPFILIGNWL
jgi:CHAT domain-containing protein